VRSDSAEGFEVDAHVFLSPVLNRCENILF
jgi:hypothetical protein